MAMLYGIRVRILTSKYMQAHIEKLIKEQLQETTTEKLTENKNKHEGEEKTGGPEAAHATQGKFEIHVVDNLKQQHFQTKVSVLIVDSKICLAEDLKEYNSKNNDSDDEVLSLATYSNSESFVLTYFSIFETLWTQTELTQSIR